VLCALATTKRARLLPSTPSALPVWTFRLVRTLACNNNTAPPPRLTSRDIHVNANYVSDLCCPLALAPLPDSPGPTCPPSDRQVSPASRPCPWSHIQALSAADCPTSTTIANSRRVRARFVSAPCRQSITLVHTGAIKGQQLPLQP